MISYIAVATSEPTPQPNNTQNNNNVPLNATTGTASVAIAIIGMLIGKWMPWGEIAKQFAGTRTSKVLQSEDRKTQEIEAEIDINQGLSETVSTIAQRSVDNTSKITEDLLQLVSGAISSSTANAQSTQALSRASESQVKATEDLINATVHNSQALEALREAVQAIPKETASILEIHAAELRTALNNIDDRLNESNRIKHDFKELVTAIKCPKIE